MRLVTNNSAACTIGAGRPVGHLSLPFVYLTWRDQEWLHAGKGGLRAKLADMMAENPGVPIVGESIQGRVEPVAGDYFAALLK